MKDKKLKRTKQSLKIELYERLIIQLVQIITAAGIKLPPHILGIIEIIFPALDKDVSSSTVKEFRCKYCRLKRKCQTSMYKFQPGGCKDKFRKSILYFWKNV